MLRLAEARIIVDHALRHARDHGFPPMTVAVLDGGGQLIAFAREDESSLLREKIARAKAMSALNMGTGTRTLAQRAEHHPHFINAITTLAEGEIIPVPGGVLVRDPESGKVIGAVGVSGHRPDEDEACAVHGIRAAELAADTG
ncbi:GlcG/HbpS family heme-binding protein [Nonomuraea antimicrobica]